MHTTLQQSVSNTPAILSLLEFLLAFHEFVQPLLPPVNFDHACFVAKRNDSIIDNSPNENNNHSTKQPAKST